MNTPACYRFSAFSLVALSLLVGGAVLAQAAGPAWAGQAAATSAPGQVTNPVPGVDCPELVNFGEIHVNAIAQAQLLYRFKGVTNPGLSLQVEVPKFLTVEHLWLFRKGQERADEIRFGVTVGLDTRSAGTLTGKMKARLGDQEVTIPVAASVIPQVPGQTKVLVVWHGSELARFRPGSEQPWFDFVRENRLDVSYVESSCFFELFYRLPGAGGYVLPVELAAYDVILLTEGGVVELDVPSSLQLMQFADSGKRVIVTASPAMGESVLHANRILEPLGMRMIDRDVDSGGRGAIPTIEAARIEPDELMEGVKKLSTFRPAPIQITNPEKATLLAQLPESPNGFVAVTRRGNGEIVAFGGAGLSRWLGERGQGTDNARLLRNLLTPRAKP